MIPCKRPRVTVEPFPTGIRVVCHVSGCGFRTEGHAVKAGAEEEARWHRQAHRATVPNVHGHTCECGWEPSPGTVTKSDRDASLAYHLSAVHGLVT